ncbi:DUF2637 domain-containing protein [Tsukamurella pseudospumae]|uniref:Uncharacterized protein n=1 Tax=Tsukamurella pseudospumae TaxID=239498 RepID=A0A138AE55_9ACTN|nr:DUF2637 domain-containing protein [Tsukamurella pseudospumae]KXP08744.1 hypothetical protein AXK60_08705 [Tsukamurella pseudospumae]
MSTTPQRFWVVSLISAVTVSVAGNVGHALLSAPADLRVPAAVAAALPPIALLAVTEGLARTAGHGLRRWAYRVGVAGALAIAVLAFVLSFAALRDLAITLGQPPAVAAGWPLLADATIAVASVMLLAARPETQPIVHHDADEAAEPAAKRDADTVTHEVHHSAEPAYPAGLAWMTQPSTRSIDRDAKVASQLSISGDTMHQLGDAAADSAPASRSDATRRRDAATVTQVGDAAASAPRRTAVTQLGDAADRDAEILRRARDGESSREIAAAMGISPSTAQRVIRRAA